MYDVFTFPSFKLGYYPLPFDIAHVPPWFALDLGCTLITLGYILAVVSAYRAGKGCG
jgi:hypothetical protein